MKTVSVRDPRHKWPETEAAAALATHPEIIITRDSKPVARLVAIAASKVDTRPRFDFKRHMERLKANGTLGLADALQRAIERDRNDE